MNNSDITQYSLLHLCKSSFYGTCRGFFVELFLYPFDVVKMQKQCKDSEKTIAIARRLFQQEGYRAFYRGLSPKLVQTGIKQMWCWPMMTGVPKFLRPYKLGDSQEQIVTGLSIATVDAVITNPLERAKILSALTKKIPFSFRSVYKNGWQGFTTYWMKRSINLISFLTAQKYFRERSRKQSGEDLGFCELTKVSVQVALVVSLFSTPFDLANTLKQAQNLSPTYLLSRKRVSRLYCAWHINAFILVIHSLTSVFLLEKFN